MLNNSKENLNNSLLFKKYNIDVFNIKFVSEADFSLELSEKSTILEKLLEAHELALANVKAGNITGRAFATNVCTKDNYWSLGTNFNNTRNDISSICGERSAILAAYNDALIRFSKSGEDRFSFKIKYLCMAQSVEFEKMTKTAVPCEDCLSWLNTNRCFDDNTTIFSFEKNNDYGVFVRATKLCELLPYKDFVTSNNFDLNKEIVFSESAKEIVYNQNISKDDIYNLLLKTHSAYLKNNLAGISNQNIACSILTEKDIYTSNKVDWTRRWHCEPLEICSYKAINAENSMHIKAICYFGDEFAQNGEIKYHDKIVSIKSLGRIRQKHATNNTLLILNFEEKILIITLGEYLPKKFIQGYKI